MKRKSVFTVYRTFLLVILVISWMGSSERESFEGKFGFGGINLKLFLPIIYYLKATNISG